MSKKIRSLSQERLERMYLYFGESYFREIVERYNAWKRISSFMPALHGAMLELESIRKSMRESSYADPGDIVRFMACLEGLDGLDEAIETTERPHGADFVVIHCELQLIRGYRNELGRMMPHSLTESSHFTKQRVPEMIEKICHIDNHLGHMRTPNLKLN